MGEVGEETGLLRERSCEHLQCRFQADESSLTLRRRYTEGAEQKGQGQTAVLG